jgi:hypothetical protein
MILCKGMLGTLREEEDVRKMAILGFVLLLGTAVAGAADLHKVLEQNQPPVARKVDVTWLTQPPNQSNAYFSDVSCDICGGPQVLADNVVIITGGVLSSVTQAIIWGGYFPDNIPVAANFEIIIHSDAGGLPGATICQYSVAPISDVLTGVVLPGGVDEHQITLEFFDYCFFFNDTATTEIYTDTGPGTDDWGWETGNVDPTNGIPGLAYAFSAPGSEWTYESTVDMAITLNGIPMPVELQSFDIE